MDIVPSYYSVIPANIRYDKDICPNAKLLYGEITALSNKEGFCWAENSYFAELYGVSEKSISSWISQLANKNYICREIIYKDNTKQIENRKLSIRPMEDNFHTPMEENFSPPMEKKVKDNIIKEINIINSETKHRYGEYDNILLSDKEYQKLKSEYSEETLLRAIQWFSAYIVEKGYKCKSHYLAMKRWVFEAINKKFPTYTIKETAVKHSVKVI